MKKNTVVILFFTGTILLLLFNGCGGGFNGDSAGADDVGEAIFGPDSTKQ